MSEEERNGGGRVIEGLDGELRREFADLLSTEEIDTLRDRCA